MSVEGVTPEEYMGDMIGDLNSRRGQVGSMDTRGNARVVERHGPAGQYVRLREHAALHESGRAQFTMVFDHYEQVPQAVADEVPKMA